MSQRIQTTGETASGIQYTVYKPTRQGIASQKLLYSRIIDSFDGETNATIGDVETYCMISTCVSLTGGLVTCDGVTYQVPEPEADIAEHRTAFRRFMDSYPDDAAEIKAAYDRLQRSLAEAHLAPDEMLTPAERADPN